MGALVALLSGCDGSGPVDPTAETEHTLVASKLATLAVAIAIGPQGRGFLDNFIPCPRRGVVDYRNTSSGRSATVTGCDLGDGVTVEDGYVVRREGTVTHRVLARGDVRLRGEHNLANVLEATALASMLGAPDEAIAGAVREFRGVPHRLEPVETIDGVLWVNDSIATTPERTLAGLRSYTEPVVLLLGGRDKQLPLEELAAEAGARCRAVVTFGEAGELFASAVRADAPAVAIERVSDLESAVHAAGRLARRGAGPCAGRQFIRASAGRRARRPASA